MKDPNLTPIERSLLAQKNYDDEEIAAIGRIVTGTATQDDFRRVPRTSRLSSPSEEILPEPEEWTDTRAAELAREQIIEDLGLREVIEALRAKEANGPHPLGLLRVLTESGVEYYDPADEEYPGLEELWKQGGVTAVLEQHHDFVVAVNSTYYTFRDWAQVRNAFQERELTPLPTRYAIEEACGRQGLDLPYVDLDGTRYFDFEFLGKPAEVKALRHQEHAQAREEVMRYLVGARLERCD